MLYRTRFKLGQIINVKSGDSYEIDSICLTRTGIRYAGICFRTQKDRVNSRWALPEKELIEFKTRQSKK
jgi:hypothetical protein